MGPMICYKCLHVLTAMDFDVSLRKMGINRKCIYLHTDCVLKEKCDKVSLFISTLLFFPL
jgi:hypothetical protein